MSWGVDHNDWGHCRSCGASTSRRGRTANLVCSSWYVFWRDLSGSSSTSKIRASRRVVFFHGCARLFLALQRTGGQLFDPWFAQCLSLCAQLLGARFTFICGRHESFLLAQAFALGFAVLFWRVTTSGTSATRDRSTAELRLVMCRCTIEALPPACCLWQGSPLK